MIDLLNPDGKQRPCSCRACLIAEGLKDVRFAVGGNIWWMVLCAICGNKRCPHATDHQHKCTNSNELWQVAEVE